MRRSIEWTVGNWRGRSDSAMPREGGVMSAILLMVILIGGAVITFFVRFLIALYKESRSHRAGSVKTVYEGYK